ncbi:NAD-P-binding protein [Trametes elegans]|nr:NAD-P-binding protein [Trametes elegans]
MSERHDLPLVLVLGGTGNTGSNTRVAALVRPGSVSKPIAQELLTSGAEIRIGDLTDGVEKLKGILTGVDILISVVAAWMIDAQKDVFLAAKAVGVKRVVPCDFGTPGVQGIRELHDQKLAIHEYIQDLGLPYTFIDVGWWMQLSLPLPARSSSKMKALLNEVHGAGHGRMLVTDLNHIGAFVARIVTDPRTLNRAVIVWEDELTQLDAHEIGERVSGDAEALKAQRIYVLPDDLQRRIAEMGERAAKTPDDVHGVRRVLTWSQYMYSIHILGENTLENAKRLGYLDAHDLYPDAPKRTLENFAQEFYSLEDPFVVYD